MIPEDYRKAWVDPAGTEALIEGLLGWKLNALANLAEAESVDSRSVEEVGLEMHLRQLVTAYLGCGSHTETDRGEVIVCALVNVLGTMVMAGCESDLEARSRALKIADRTYLFYDPARPDDGYH